MSAPMQTFDANLGDILQNVRQIDGFLDVVFEFLYRRTDFYRIMRDDKDTMGLPPGAARRLVMQAFMKYEQMCKIPAPTVIEQDSVPAIGKELEVTNEQGTSQGTSNEIKGQESTDVKTADTTSTSSDVDSVGKKMEKIGVKDGHKSSSGSDPKSQLTKADTYNGALRDGYAWSQTLSDVDIKVFVPGTLKMAKQLSVEIKQDHIKVAVKDPATGPQLLIDGKLSNRINCEESMWNLDSGKYVQINLEKRTETWWKSVLEGEPLIEQQSIDNTQHVHDMDEDAQTDYRRVMHDFEQKRQGNPTSKEMETQEMLRKAWDIEGSPFKGSEYDPTKLNINSS